MKKTLIGISTYGNLPFTQLTINSIRETTRSPIDIFVVVGRPGDAETAAWLDTQEIPYVAQLDNLGFPVALNDIMDYAWGASAAHDRHVAVPADDRYGQVFKREESGALRHFTWNEFSGAPEIVKAWSYDNLIIAGNDIVAYPRAVDALIEEAARGEWEWICSSQFDVKSLVARYPELAREFSGPNLNFTNWRVEGQGSGVVDHTPGSRPWEQHQDFHSPAVQPDCIKDVRNLCLFRRSVFEKIGYADVNFWPGGYFEDNDYCTRARKAGVKACGLAHSAYFHFWSRTIHQVLQGAEISAQHRQFQNNAEFYRTKWGGAFDHEKYALPFGGSPYGYCDPALGISFHHGDGRLKIESRTAEKPIVDHWRGRA